jgi:DNA polymerase I-like protein with 3'-5' exonuclease and polymerase domains
MTPPSCRETWAVDTEWGFRDGRLDHESAWEPVVVCLVGLRSGRRLHFWGRDPRLRTFFRDHADDLFVAHSATAELKYLLRLGIPLPRRWIDTFVAWRYITNRPNNLEAGLSVALHRLGLPSLAPAEKKALQMKIARLEFDPDSPDDRREIVEYCFSDCDGCGALYPRIHERVPPALMAHWVEYLKAVARMELRGIPFDVEGYTQIRRNRAAIRSALIGDTNRTWPVYRGESFCKRAFLGWCRSVGVDWPAKLSARTGKPYFPMDKETMKGMEGRHPFIAEVRQVEKTLKQLSSRSLVVDPVTRRHHFGTSVFRSVTGRNQPRNFVFSGPKWLRLLIVPESYDHVLVYVDYTAQEVGIAAALSTDPAMRAIYEATDCHMQFAIRAGAAPAGATKRTHGEVRKQYKTVNLGVLYGQTGFGMAARLGIAQQEAELLLADHRRLFPRYWEWSERIVQGSFDRGWIVTPCGWRSRVPPLSNERTWMNFPMQATGGDIMRLTVTYLDRQNVRILAIVHDGFLLSCRRDQLPDLRAAVDYACSCAVEHVLPGFPLRWDFTVYDNGRFDDEDGLALWHRLQEIRREVDRAQLVV